MTTDVRSYVGLFEQPDAVKRIVIPLFQRDYAQGRDNAEAERVRVPFVKALHKALTGGPNLGLDFVYGSANGDTFEPLDGQQRLTTLFLLHWYVASLTGNLDATEPWTQFAYATRPSAQRFCGRLVEHPYAAGGPAPSVWITEQNWYLFPWRHDPTIQSMLVMVDAINDLFSDSELHEVWKRLTDAEDPAVTFHRLVISEMGSPEELYIKMNSRGKPLTAFENFKAEIEDLLEGTERAERFAELADTKWADVMWEKRDPKTSLFDDKYLSYITLVVRLSEWRNGDASWGGGDLIDRADALFGTETQASEANLQFLFDAFDAWTGEDGKPIDTERLFDSLLAKTTTPGKVVVFGDTRAELDLFKSFISRDNRVPRRGDSLLFYAILLHRIHRVADFPRRLRVVRNLIEASTNQIRQEFMPGLIADVHSIVVDGDLRRVTSFNTEQLEDEIRKGSFLADHPELQPAMDALEDHELIRGCVMAFDFDAERFAARAEAFLKAFDGSANYPLLTAAMLAAGDYMRPLSSSKYRAGSPTNAAAWRLVFAPAAPSREAVEPARNALTTLLDRLAGAEQSVDASLIEFAGEYLSRQEEVGRFDWRYYMVKYPAMRSAAPGVFAAFGGWLGFSMCMFRRVADSPDNPSFLQHYFDPYLQAVVAAAGSGAATRVMGGIENHPDEVLFTGQASEPRWMLLKRSGTRIRCVDGGFLVLAPTESEHEEAFVEVCQDHDMHVGGEEFTLVVPQVAGGDYDTEDRVQIGGTFLAALLERGL